MKYSERKISLCILLLTDFLKRFMFRYIIFNCLDCLETKIMTKTADNNFISNNVKGIQNSLKNFKIFNCLKESISFYFFKKFTLLVKMK